MKDSDSEAVQDFETCSRLVVRGSGSARIRAAGGISAKEIWPREIAALSGVQDNARHFQISVPVQPGNSGGALVEERGNVVGVVSAKLSARAALAASGALPENVNYAVKSSFLLSFLEAVPEVSAKFKAARPAERKFEDVVKDAEQTAVLVLVY